MLQTTVREHTILLLAALLPPGCMLQRHGVSVGYFGHPVDQSTPPTFNTSAYGYHTVLPGAVTDLQVGCTLL